MWALPIPSSERYPQIVVSNHTLLTFIINFTTNLPLYALLGQSSLKPCKTHLISIHSHVTEAQRQKATGPRSHSYWQSWAFLSPFVTVRGRIYNRSSSCLSHLVTWGWSQVPGQDPEKEGKGEVQPPELMPLVLHPLQLHCCQSDSRFYVPRETSKFHPFSS